MHQRKKTGVHGTLEMIPLTWKFNSKQLLSKTLNSRMNIIETRAVLNMVKTGGKWAPDNLDKVLQTKLFPTMINKKVGNGNINHTKRAYLRKRVCLRRKLRVS